MYCNVTKRPRNTINYDDILLTLSISQLSNSERLYGIGA